jgi:hypothetical protein
MNKSARQVESSKPGVGILDIENMTINVEVKYYCDTHSYVQLADVN